MIIHYGYDDLRLVSPVVTLGIFDGVHRGHRRLLEILVSRARESEGESVVMTFSPHPRIVLEKDHKDLSFLTTPEEKEDLLIEAGVDHLIILDFNNELSKMEACDFIKEILVKKIGARHLIIGYNHHFGWRGEGNFDTIKKCSETLDFRVEQVQGVATDEGSISSTLIRELLLKGLIGEANDLLGYFYSIKGVVVPGKQLGRHLGFPTANIKPGYEYKLIPGNGVYAVEVIIDAKLYRGMLSIGTNPTVNADRRVRTIEVYILDFNEDIYGKEISLIFRKKLRDEKKFENTQQLSDQIRLDKENTIRFLG